MTLILGGVTLDDNMQWIDRAQQVPVAQTDSRTVAGNLVTFAQGLTLGRPITLEANENQGWRNTTFAIVQALEALAAVAGASYSLQIEAEFFVVQFRHVDPPAVDFRPLISRLNIASTDFMLGQIKLTQTG